MLPDLLRMESCLFHWPQASENAARVAEEPVVHLASFGGALLLIAGVILAATLFAAIRQVASQR